MNKINNLIINRKTKKITKETLNNNSNNSNSNNNNNNNNNNKKKNKNLRNINYNKIYTNKSKLYEELNNKEINKFIKKKRKETKLELIDPKYYFPRLGLITIGGADKTGKGTLTNHLAYALSELGYDVLITPFPNYSGFGFYIELMSSFKQIKEIIKKNPKDFKNIDISAWSKNVQKYWELYALDRIGSAKKIENALSKGKIVLTKRGSKFTHAAYQIAFNNVTDEKMIKNLDGGFPNPMCVINLHSKEQLIKNFKQKGSNSPDYYESIADGQKKVISLQNEFTTNPSRINAKYAMFQKMDSPSERLDNVLTKINPILKKHNIKRKQTKGNIEIFGREEPKFDLRNKKGLLDFFNNTNTIFFLDLLFKEEIKKIKNNDTEKYEKLFTNQENKIDKYSISVKDSINKTIKKHKKLIQ